MSSKRFGHITPGGARFSGERGIAMITALLVMTLVSALLVGFTTVVMSDQKFRFIDRDRGQAFYAASGGLEKLTTDLGNLYFTNVSPTAAQITALTATPPTVTGVSYTATSVPDALPASQLSSYYCVSPNTKQTVGTNGYTITFCRNSSTGQPTTTANTPIKSGPYEGLIALQTPFQLDVTAHTSYGGDAHLVRTVEAVAIPVFQFGMFSDVDLSFFAGPNFNFGGRVHTNGNLFLAQGSGTTLTLSDKVTAVGEIVRQRLQNNALIGDPSAHTGTVSMARSAGVFRPLLATEGSVTDGMTPATPNEPTWHSTSLSTYNSWIRNGRTGARRLDLPLITVGGSNPDLIRRPQPNENVSSPALLAERMFSKASIRILLSDTVADITGLPGVTATAPVLLDGDWLAAPPNNGTAYGPVSAALPPIAASVGPISTTVAGGSTAANIRVATSAQLTPFLPVMRLNGAVVTCTSKMNATQFSGCTVPVGVYPSNTIVTAPGVSTNTTALLNVTVPTPNIITVAATANFRPRPFWVGTTLVNCTGWDNTPQFTGCTGLGANPAAGTVITTNALTAGGTGLIGGYLKIEMQNTAGVWSDITMQILNWGIGDANVEGRTCNNPSPNAILRLQRLRDNTEAAGTGCSYEGDATGGRDAANWWPNVLFDPREALPRDTNPGNTNFPIAGVMHYITLDVANLSEWLTATAPYAGSPGVNAMKENGGFTIYFSDRRSNRTQGSNLETAELGWEDFVNPASGPGAPNNALDGGEDVNANALLDTYGMFPSYNGVSGSVPPGALAPLDANARPWTFLTRAQAQYNRQILFRRALKLRSGANIRSVGVTGLTIVSENPVYIQGDWNATGGNFNGAHAATSVMADAVTLLSNNWTDRDTFAAPYSPGDAARARSADSWYRVAIISGKGPAFLRPSGTEKDFGTDGGAHNFLRYLEGSGGNLNYRGSIATFFFNRQAVGTYKCCSTVYSPPTRNYSFDTDFLTPALLPPNTPKFRDLNAVGFSQEIRPGK